MLNNAGVILIIDDDKSIRELLRAALSFEGYAIICAADGQQALEVIKQQMPALILLDKDMPIMNGSQFALAYRKLSMSPAPIIAVAALPDIREFAREIGAERSLSKPFDLDKLFALAAHYLR